MKSNSPDGFLAGERSGSAVGVRANGVGGFHGVRVGNDDVGCTVGVGSHGQANAGGVGHGALHVGMGCGVGVASGDCATGKGVDNGDLAPVVSWVLRKSMTSPTPNATSINKLNRPPTRLNMRFMFWLLSIVLALGEAA